MPNVKRQIRLSVLNRMYGDQSGAGLVVKHLPGVGEQEVPSNQILQHIKAGDIVELPVKDSNTGSDYDFFKVLPDLEMPPVSESMKQLHKKLIFNLTESNYAEANKLLEQIAEQKVRDRISSSLKRVDEGLFDRLGARVSGLGAGLKAKAQNVATRVGSTAKALGQNVAGAATGKGFTQGQATVDAANKQIANNDPAKRAKAAKADALIASFAKDLSILYPGLNPQKLLGNLRAQINLARPAAPNPSATPPTSNPAVKKAAPVTANP